MTAPVQHPMYIDGQFVSGRGDGWIDVLNPATEALLSRIPDGTAEEARLAIDAAERAQPGWEALPAIERAGWLRKIAAGIRQRADEIAGLIVAEGGKIPVRAVRTSQNSVRMYKHGSGYEFTYEFNRRASLDIITPFAARVARRLEISKVAAATAVLVGGDIVNGPATPADLATYGADFTGSKTLKDNYRALAKFIMNKWKAGYPIDTIACNFDLYVEMMFMFAQTNIGTASDVQNLAAAGAPSINLPVMNGAINVVLSSTIADGYFVAFVKSETLEELVEAGSIIAESERSITTQVVTYVRSENTGYKLSFGDTRFLVKAKA